MYFDISDRLLNVFVLAPADGLCFVRYKSAAFCGFFYPEKGPSSISWNDLTTSVYLMIEYRVQSQKTCFKVKKKGLLY
jgi:hypothetical protein